jgi:DNA segregation ATPase FtsK/SpoIIIE-like protein
MDLKFKGNNDADYIKQSASMIEMTLKAFGIFVRVCKINILDKFYEYYLEVAVGTDLKKLEKHSRDLAMVLASPTGKVYWQIPVPGKIYAGLKVPKLSKEYFEKIRLEEEARIKNNGWRSKIAFPLFLLGKLFYFIALKIVGVDKKIKKL